MTERDIGSGSRNVAAAALRVAVSAGVEDEQRVRAERAIVAARREGVIGTTHLEEGAVAGAAREALSQIMNKAIGLNIGGKIAIARQEEHVSVAMFFGIGLLHLNEVAVGLGHRAI